VSQTAVPAAATQSADGPLPRGLIVSCQAPRDDPLNAPSIMAAFAEAAAAGGAVAIRANGVADIRAIKERVALPVLGLFKADLDGSPVRITPTRDHARAIADAGADVIAIDATDRMRLPNESFGALVETIVGELGLAVCADVATLAEGSSAAALGAAYVATTLAGYTDETSDVVLPHLELVTTLASTVPVPVLAEGGIVTPQHALEAMERGAYAVVVGTAITRPEVMTRRFASRLGDVLPPVDSDQRAS
jgi:putative N-acetylmannosamine-6-phosphate epimerase